MLDLKTILLIIVAILNIILALVIYYKNKRSEINISFGIFAFSVGLWSLIIALYIISQNLNTAMFLMRSSYIAALMIGSSFFYFSLVFPGKSRSYNLIKIILSILFFSFIVIVFIPNFLTKYIIIHQWGKETILGWYGYLLFTVFFISTFVAGLVILWKKFFANSGIIKKQLLFIVLSVSIAGVCGILFNLILPSPFLQNFKYIWAGPLFTTIIVGAITYAILRYRLMDIRIVARKIFVYIGAATFTYGIFYAVIWVYNIFFGGVHTKNAYLASLVIAPTFVAGLYGFTKLITKIANKYFFFSLYNYQETINKLTDELSHYIDLDKIISLIVDTIKKTMQLDRAGVLLINTETNPAYYEIAKIIGFNQQNGISLVKDNFLIKYLQKNQKPLVRDELSFLSRDTNLQNEKQNFNRLFEHMKYIEASLCLPLVSNKKLIGLIVLGDKISGDAYAQEDLELLNTMSNQAAIALENARLYKQVQDFSKTLQSKVDEQTKYLKELLTMKSDFLRVVNHQLNTPLSVMKGYFSMLEEGSYPTEKALPAIKSGLERISSTVADFWHAYELEGERMKMEPQPTDITEIVNRLIPEKQKMQLTRERKLIIKVKESEFKMPPVWCDYKKIAHVISNLLDNAVHYTRAGKITVSYELLDNNYLKVNIKDTGVGLAEEDKQKLFQKFSRGNNATDLQPDGSGLGLFIAKKIVEGNFGQLSYFSDGKNQGSTFSFTIPIYKNQRPNASQEKPVSRKKIMIFNKV